MTSIDPIHWPNLSVACTSAISAAPHPTLFGATPAALPTPNIILPAPTGRRALIVVDMQSSFPAACDLDTRNNCAELVRMFVNNNEHIFMLEYIGNGESFYDVTRPMQGFYEHVFWTRKSQNDGSIEVMPLLGLLESSGVTIDEFIVCGVNTGLCVADTVEGLMIKTSAKITVVANAVNDDRAPNDNWDPMEKIKSFQRDNEQLSILE